MGRKIWIGQVPMYGRVTSYDPPDEKLRQFMKEQDVIDVKVMTGNPYYEQFTAEGLRQLSFEEEMEEYRQNEHLPPAEQCNHIIRRAKARDEMIKLYAWAVPTPEVIAYIRSFLEQGIYEIGAGSGYWARMITDSWHDLNYYAFDNYSSHGFTHRYYDVSEDPLLSIESYRSLFLCWPKYKDPFAFEAVRDLKPRHVFYVGEPDGCTADDNFSNIMEELYDEVENTPDVERHQHLHDHFYHYKMGGP